MFINTKLELKKKILEKFATYTNFIKLHPELKLTNSSLSQTLSPRKNCTIETLENIADKLDMEFTLSKKMKIRKVN